MISSSLLYRLNSLRKQLCIGINIFNLFHQEKCNKWIRIRPINTSLIDFKKEYGNKKCTENKTQYTELKVWKDMTVEDLVTALNCDIGAIERVLNVRKAKDKILSKQDFQIIGKYFCKKLTYLKSPYEEKKELNFVRQPPPDPKNLIRRPPVVTIMGHVDHGKTTLLDALRNSFVVEQEFGGITQHIGAFSVEVKSGKKVTFIDTPGHAAFTAMRTRGAQVTDIVVLVIAADDGVMEQTIESIKIASKAQVKMIIAVNKIDKANIQKIEDIKNQLLLHDIQVEDKGGNIQLIPISAKKKINLDLLVEMILVEAEIMNLKGDPNGLVEGVVIESKKDKNGVVATVIVKRGTLKKRKILIADKSFVKVRLILDENGKELEEATLSTAVQVTGWKDLPAAGDNIFEVSSEKEANRLVKLRHQKELVKKQKEDLPIIMEKIAKEREKYKEISEKRKLLRTGKDFFYFYKELKLQKKGVKEISLENNFPQLNVIIKGDVHGSIEVLLDLIDSYDKNDECILKVIHSSVGSISLSDIEKAEAANAIIYAFNVDLHPAVEELNKVKKLPIRKFNVIYKMMDDIKDEITSRLPLKDVENILGEAQVKENFFINVKKKKIPCAGSVCIKGELKKNCLFKIIRDEKIILENGKLSSMKHFKKDVDIITKNVSCGLMFETFTDDFKPLDKIICYEIVQVPKKSTWDLGFNTSEN